MDTERAGSSLLGARTGWPRQPESDRQCRVDRGVAPVIGVVLLVAVVVVLAAAAAGVLLNTGGTLSEPTPTLSVEVHGTDDGTVVLEHAGGDTVSEDELAVLGATPVDGLPDEFAPGATIEVEPDEAEDELRLRWDNGDDASVLETVDVDTTLAQSSGEGTADQPGDDTADDSADDGVDDSPDDSADDGTDDGSGGDDSTEGGDPDFSENPWLEDSQTGTIGVFYEQGGEFEPVGLGQNLSELPEGTDLIYVFIEDDPDEVEEGATITVEETDGSVFGTEQVAEDVEFYDESAFESTGETGWAVAIDGPEGGDGVVLEEIDAAELTVTWKESQ